MTEPVTLEEAKAHLEIEVDETKWDDQISAFIVAAREFVENDTGHVLVQRSFTEARDCFGRYLELYHRPVVSVASIGYKDTSGADQNYTGAVYSLNRNPARIFPALNGWFPPTQRNTSVVVTYTAGYEPADVPQTLIQAMKLLISHWFAQREAVNVSTATPTDVPFAVSALLGQYRAPSL